MLLATHGPHPKERDMAIAADAQVCTLPLSDRRVVAERTLEFRLVKPTGMTFKAGQFMDVTLIQPPETDAEGNTRGFSINSAPQVKAWGHSSLAKIAGERHCQRHPVRR
jgi:NAD(P)H-flavin reductase